ncbi:MAG: hypothetical protein ABFQ65_00685 [Nanoarchaeota archaeon]
MRRVIGIGFLVFIFCLSFISSVITKEEIKEKLEQININDFKISKGDFDKSVVIIGKAPNYYKEVVTKKGEIVWYDICYKDKWLEHYDETTDMTIRTDYNMFFNFLKKFFGISSPCKKMFESRLSEYSLTPENYLSLDYPFEEDIFEGKEVIKFKGEYPGSIGAGDPLEDFDAYYDRKNLILVAKKFYCNNNDFSKCIYKNGTIEYFNEINQGVQESDFTSPEISEMTKICEKDLEKISNLTLALNNIEESLWVIQGLTEKERVDKKTKEMRKLTREEYNLFIDLKLQFWEAECKEKDEISICSYAQYLERKDRFNECKF